jgi:co-chaperonin GroES (HSP10)
MKQKKIEAPVFPYTVTKGHVVLCYEDKTTYDFSGFEEPHRKTKVRSAIIVSVGQDDVYGMHPSLTVGRRVLMPAGNKQLFEFNGNDYYLVHHLDIKVIDPADDDELVANMLIEQFKQMSLSAKTLFIDLLDEASNEVLKNIFEEDEDSE